MTNEVAARVIQHLKSLRSSGVSITSVTVLATVQAVYNLSAPSVPHKFQPSWAQKWMKANGFVWRKATSGKVTNKDELATAATEFHTAIHEAVNACSIPCCAIFNMDHTGLMMAPTTNKTLELRGAKEVTVSEKGDKRQITGMGLVSMDGMVHPFTVIVPGKTKRSHPLVRPQDQERVFIFSSGSKNHFCTSSLTKRYVEEVLHSVRISVIHKNNLSEDQFFLIILDRFSGQIQEDIVGLLLSYGFVSVYVPAGWTGKLQPLDVAVFSGMKLRLREKFLKWYTEQVMIKMRQKENQEQIIAEARATAASSGTDFNESKYPQVSIQVDMRTTTIRDQHLAWVLDAYFSTPPDTVKAGFKKAGVLLEQPSLGFEEVTESNSISDDELQSFTVFSEENSIFSLDDGEFFLEDNLNPTEIVLSDEEVEFQSETIIIK